MCSLTIGNESAARVVELRVADELPRYYLLFTTYSSLLTLYYLLFTTDSQGNESAARVVELRVADELPVLSIGLGADDFNR